MSHESASALQIFRVPDGAAFVAIDSLVDLFEDMARNVSEGPGHDVLMKLAETFRPISSYTELERTAGNDDSAVQVRLCACGTPVFTARTLSSGEMVVNAEPDPECAYLPMKIRDGVPLLAPYRDALDGVTNVRFSLHQCGAS